MTDRQGYTLFIFRSAPYDSHKAREGIDALLAAAAFDQPIKLLFMNDGVFQLNVKQSPSFTRNVEKQLKAISFYGVEDVFVHEPSLQKRNLSSKQLVLSAELIENQDVSFLTKGARHVLSF